MTDAIINFIVALCLAIVGGLYAMLKMIFTNHTKIKVLESELNSLSIMLSEVRDDQKEIFQEIRKLKH